MGSLRWKTTPIVSYKQSALYDPATEILGRLGRSGFGIEWPLAVAAGRSSRPRRDNPQLSSLVTNANGPR